MSRRTPPPRTPTPDGGIAPVVAVFLLIVGAAVVAAGVHLWLGLFTTPSSADIQFQDCDPQEDSVTIRLLDGGPILYRALGLTVSNHTSGETELRLPRLDLDGHWSDGRFLRLGSADANADNLPPDDWDLASPGGLDNRSVYGIRVTDRGEPPARPLADLDFPCN